MIWLVNYTPSNRKPIGISCLAIVNKAFSLISLLRVKTHAKAYHFITYIKCNIYCILRVSQVVKLLYLLLFLLFPYLVHNLCVI